MKVTSLQWERACQLAFEALMWMIAITPMAFTIFTLIVWKG